MGDDMHHNGALFLSQNFGFLSFLEQPRPGPVSSFEYLKQWKGRQTADGYDMFLDMGGLREISDSFQPGLHDAGVLAPGYRGDLNLIDSDRLRLLAPEVVADLPAGGKRYRPSGRSIRP